VTLFILGPREEDRFIGFPANFNEMEEDFDVDGSTYQVHIL
jgi:hypothetical protein